MNSQVVNEDGEYIPFKTPYNYDHEKGMRQDGALLSRSEQDTAASKKTKRTST